MRDPKGKLLSHCLPKSLTHKTMSKIQLFKVVSFRTICYAVRELEHSPSVNNDKIGQNVGGTHTQAVLKQAAQNCKKLQSQSRS